MEVRLLTRWGSWLQGDIVSVSGERAAALQEAGIGRVINVPQPEAKVEEVATEEVEPEKVEEVPEEKAPVETAPKPRGPVRK